MSRGAKLVRATGLSGESREDAGVRRVVLLLPLEDGRTAALALSRADDVAEILRVVSALAAATWPDDLRFEDDTSDAEGE